MNVSRSLVRAARSSAAGAAFTPRAVALPAIRSYATPAAVDSKPPVALYGLDGTYASALVRQLQTPLSPELLAVGQWRKPDGVGS
jgi:hypothetical protein